MCWICLRDFGLVGQTDGLGVGKDEEEGVWITQLSGPDDWVSNGAIQQDGTTVESRICGERSSHLRCVKCEVSADWICWMYGSGAQGEVWAGTIDVEPYRWRLER